MQLVTTHPLAAVARVQIIHGCPCAFGTSQLLLDEKPTMLFAKPAGKQQGAARASSHEDCVP